MREGASDGGRGKGGWKEGKKQGVGVGGEGERGGGRESECTLSE